MLLKSVSLMLFSQKTIEAILRVLILICRLLNEQDQIHRLQNAQCSNRVKVQLMAWVLFMSLHTTRHYLDGQLLNVCLYKVKICDSQTCGCVVDVIILTCGWVGGRNKCNYDNRNITTRDHLSLFCLCYNYDQNYPLMLIMIH